MGSIMQGLIFRIPDSHWQTCGDSQGSGTAAVIDTGVKEQLTATDLNTVLGLLWPWSII